MQARAGWIVGLVSAILITSQAHSASLFVESSATASFDARAAHPATLAVERSTQTTFPNFTSTLTIAVGVADDLPFMLAKEFDRGASGGAVTIIAPPSTGGGGDTLTGLSAVPLGGHRVVNGPLGDLSYAGPSGPLGLVLGMTTGAASAGDPVTVQTAGDIDEPSWNWTPGPVFLDANGTMTQTAPESGFLQQIGVASAPTKILIRIGPAIKLI